MTRLASAPIALLAPERRFENARIKSQVDAALRRVAFSGKWVLGEEVLALEEALAKSLHVPHTLAVKSGTDALLLALWALGIGPGDGVITSVFSFFASASTIARSQARPQFVDICPGCFCLDSNEVKAAIHANTRAILPVHLFGQPADLGALCKSAKEHQLVIIEDCAQAQGAKEQGVPVGTQSDAGCFSFFPSKNMSALGDGGLVACSDQTLFRLLTELRNHGASVRYVHDRLGGNFRLDALQAALIAAQLFALDEWICARQANAARYNEIFFASGLSEFETCHCNKSQSSATTRSSAPIGPPTERSPSTHTYNQYVLRLRDKNLRDHVAQALREAGIGSAIYYPKTLAEQPALAFVGARPEAFAHANRATKEVLALPIYAQLGADEIEHTAEVVVDAVRKFRSRPRIKSILPLTTSAPAL